MSQRRAVCDALRANGIPFTCVEHPAVFTVEAMQKLDFPPGSVIAKNLFLRDAKGKRHFLVSVDASQAVDLNCLREKLASAKLSFASPERLHKYLGLTKGSVSPFGLSNDTAQAVAFYLDEKLMSVDVVGVHPNDNTATVLIAPEHLVKWVRSTGHEVHMIRFAL